MHPGEEAIHETLVPLTGDPQERAETGRELVLVELPDLEPPQERERLGILAEELLDSLAIEALGVAEGAKAVPDVGGEDAAEVDEQPS